MFEWSETHQSIRKMFRQYMEKEVAPHVEAMETGEMLPYDLFRKIVKDFGIRDEIGARFAKGDGAEKKEKSEGDEDSGGGMSAIGQLLMIEMSRISPGFTMSFGASIGLAGFAIMKKGTPEQRERWGLPLLRFDKIGAWGLTEPSAGSDAFGSMRTRAKRDGATYILNGSKTFITNAPYADTFVIYAKVEDEAQGNPIRSFVVERGTPGLATGEPMKKMGMCGSPTGEIFLDDCRVPADQLLGGERAINRDHVKESLQGERGGLPAMALGIIERCLEDSLRYVQEREQFGQPIANFQLVQAKLARMYIHYENVRNLVFKQIWAAEGRGTMKDASVCKVYGSEAATQVALDAIQIHGGYGYMREYQVERFMRDAKLLEIGAGTTEIQLLTIARELLSKGLDG
ncbi:MAG: acyl-CoA dehydrogenase family protein [Myxococcales bacterium]|nr:acyl-CoA dehydrogenase family protein [Myxococcales bacterium]